MSQTPAHKSGQSPHVSAREQFGRQAALYARSTVHASGDTLDIVRTWADPQAGQFVLDVGAGAGFTAFELAPNVQQAVACDATFEMLRQAGRLARERRLDNVRCVQGLAEALPLPAASFHTYTCRMAAHHFASPSEALKEAGRVLRPGGRAIFVDIISPSDAAAAAWQDRVERLRDPSHQRDYAEVEWRHLFREAAFGEVTLTPLTHVETSMEDWAVRAGATAEGLTELRQLFASAPPEAAAAFQITPHGEDFGFTWPALAILGVRA